MEVENEEIVAIHKKLKHDQDVEKNGENSSTIAVITSAYLNSENQNVSNSDMSYDGDSNEVDQVKDDDAIDDYSNLSNYSDDEDYFYGDYDDNDDYSSMQAQLDNVDLPPGVEASVSWMETTLNSKNSNNYVSTNVSAEVLAELSSSVAPPVSSGGAHASSSLSVYAESSSSGKEREQGIDEVVRKYVYFKQFDVVDDHSDHHYNNSGFKGQQQPPKAWSKKIQDEWKILEKDLPGTIYVRVYESRMDLLRAIIIGPQGTPYHDGLFVFDIVFPPTYPNTPPMVYYYSGGLRLNPNLYDCGKVCLSLLNTWSGKGSEKWQPMQSTMLQVLVSIQALILNAEPFYNEPGYEDKKGTAQGDARSKKYSEEAFTLSVKTMMYTLRRPPKHFEDLVAGHFRACGHNILSACKAYTEGVLVGSLINGKVPAGSEIQKGGSSVFKATVGRMINGVVSNFTRFGVPDCEQFRVTNTVP